VLHTTRTCTRNTGGGQVREFRSFSNNLTRRGIRRFVEKPADGSGFRSETDAFYAPTPKSDYRCFTKRYRIDAPVFVPFCRTQGGAKRTQRYTKRTDHYAYTNNVVINILFGDSERRTNTVYFVPYYFVMLSFTLKLKFSARLTGIMKLSVITDNTN